jgi:hypothetical protein
VDKLTTYRKLITRLLSELSDLSNRCPTPGVESVCAFDEERDQYLLLTVGWHGNRRASGTTLHLRIRGGKIWVEEDWTEDGIANALLRAGVPNDDIILAFQAPDMRKFTQFATP